MLSNSHDISIEGLYSSFWSAYSMTILDNLNRKKAKLDRRERLIFNQKMVGQCDEDNKLFE